MPAIDLAFCLLVAAFPLLALPVRAADEPSQRLRIIIETDAGGDPDDEQSLVRFLLYTSEWDVEGIIANRPTARDGENLNTERTGLGIVRRQIDAYGDCHAKLVQHDPRFPTRAYLHAHTVAGHNETDDGVRLIIEVVDRDDPRPVWFCNWGTDDGSAQSCLLRALDKVLSERGPEGYAQFKNRLRLSSSDEFGAHTFEIAPAFPIWVDTFRPEIDGRRWYHRFSAVTAKAGGFDIERDVRTGHGPLGALYPTNTTHDQKEGDSMSFIYLIPTGMNNPNQPGWGSWAGRYGLQDDSQGRAYYWANVADAWNGTTHREHTLARWAEQLQSDFRARLDWCVKDYDDANHRPVLQIADTAPDTVQTGDAVQLDVASVSDPDGNAVKYSWAYYPEASGAGVSVELQDAETRRARFIAPAVQTRTELHFVLAVTDSGEPPLTASARRVIVVAPD